MRFPPAAKPAGWVVTVTVLLIFQHAGFLTGPVEAFHDWDQHLLYADAARWALLHGEGPFWNRFPCGGIPLIAHPESRLLTPMFILHILFDVMTALRIEVVLHLLIAALGAGFLVLHDRPFQRLGNAANTAGAVVAAVVFAGSSFFALHLEEGHIWILSAAYLPWVALAFEDALTLSLSFTAKGLARAALSGLLLALMIGEGGIYPAPMGALLLFLLTVVAVGRTRSPRPCLSLLVAALATVVSAAPKLVPLARLMSRRQRLVASDETMSPLALLHALIDRDQRAGRLFNWSSWPWHEQGAYVGALALLLALWALVARSRPASRRQMIPTALFAVLALGSFASFAPWPLLRHLPLFRSQHVPSRFAMMLVLLLARLAGHGASDIVDRLSRWRVCALPSRQRAVAVSLSALVVADVMVVREGLLSRVRCVAPMLGADRPDGRVVTLRRAPSGMYCHSMPPILPSLNGYQYSALDPSARAGLAVLDAYEPLCPRSGGLVGREPGISGSDERDYRGEAWVERGVGTVEISAAGSNGFTATVHARTPVEVRFTVNWDEGWSIEGPGSLLLDAAGVLAFQVPSGEHVVRASYRPPGWPWAAPIGLSATLAVLAWALVEERRRAT